MQDAVYLCFEGRNDVCGLGACSKITRVEVEHLY